MDQSLAAVMRNINDALRLDDDCHDKEAYLKYLDCVLCITCSLQQYVRARGGDVVITKEVTKQVKLAQQCIDRVAVLVEKIGSSQRPVVLASPPEETSPGIGKAKPFMVVPPLPPEPMANTFARAKVNSPMEVAYRQNQQLMAAYKARLKRMNKRDPGAFNLSLTIQRKMAENLAIAKKTEMALAKKMQERQERLEEQAARRFVTPIGMSEEEQEQRQIYKQILEYEQDAKWLQAWREKLTSGPTEPELICQLIQEILRCRDHPLTLLLKRYQYKVYEKIYPIVATKRYKLESVSVPLDPSMWPPELCPMAETSFVFSGDGEGEERGGVEGEDEGVQSDQDAGSCTSVPQEEEDLHPQSGKDSSEVNSAEEEVKGRVSDAVAPGDKENGESTTSGEVSADSQIDSGCSMADSEQTTVDDGTDTSTSVTTHHHSDRTSPEKPKTAASRSDIAQVNDTDPKSKGDEVCDSDSKTTVDSASSPNMTVQGEESISTSPAQDSMEENSELSVPSSLAQVVEDSRRNVSEAIARGEHLQSQLKSEQGKAVLVLRQISQDYEKYNAENMDDLFDDDDDNEDEEEGKKMNNSQHQDPSSNTQPHNSTELDQRPYMSVSSQSSFGDPDAADSGSGSISSTQDFPSLPPMSENQSDIERLSKEAYQRHVKNISDDVHMYMEKLLILFTIAYEQLDCPQGRDQCYASLEETFFKPLWKFLLMLFRLANYKEEISLACKMTQKSDGGPRELGVTDKLCLTPADGNGSVEPSRVRPYAQAISHLACIRDHYTMLSKLECVVKVVHLIFDSIKDFYISQGHAPSDVPSVGADDLLPVMSYVVMQTRLPQLVSECQAMAEFIHEGYMMGQEGYCLTTLETAVSFLVSSDLRDPISPT